MYRRAKYKPQREILWLLWWASYVVMEESLDGRALWFISISYQWKGRYIKQERIGKWAQNHVQSTISPSIGLISIFLMLIWVRRSLAKIYLLKTLVKIMYNEVSIPSWAHLNFSLKSLLLKVEYTPRWEWMPLYSFGKQGGQEFLDFYWKILQKVDFAGTVDLIEDQYIYLSHEHIQKYYNWLEKEGN